MKIGVIDSGIGGLTTLNEMTKDIHCDYYYYMDNANIPYGDKDVNLLYDIGCDIVSKLLRIGVDIIVIACNTLSAMVGSRLRGRFDVPIVCIEPSIKPASMTGDRSVVLSTPNTAASSNVKRLLSRYPNVEIIAMNDLANDIENNRLNKAKFDVKEKLAGKTIKNVVLGCTHYVYLKDYITSLGYRVFEGNRGVSQRVQYIAKNKCHISVNNEDKSCKIYIHSSSSFDIGKTAKYLRYPICFW